MSDDTASVLLYAAMILLPLSALIARRPPLGRTLKMLLAWVAIFALGIVLVNQRDRLSGLFGRHEAGGREVRIPQADDGHFYASVRLDGVDRRMLIDSGATTTALSVATAKAIGLNLDESVFPAIVSTANGRVQARSATVRRLAVGAITVDDLGVVTSPAFGTDDVLGMNFLSRLASWRVEGRTMILSATAKTDFT